MQYLSMAGSLEQGLRSRSLRREEEEVSVRVQTNMEKTENCYLSSLNYSAGGGRALAR